MNLRTRLTLAGGGAVFIALAIASLVIFFNVRSKLHDQIDFSLVQTAQNILTKTAPGKLPAGTYAKASNPTYPAGPYLGSDASGYFQVIPSVSRATKQAASAAPGKRAAPTLSPPAKRPSREPAKTQPRTAILTGTLTPTGKRIQARTVKTRSPEALPTVNPNSFVPLTALDGMVAQGLAPPSFRDVTYGGTPMRLYTTRLSITSDGLVRTARPLTEANATIDRVRWLLIGLTLGGAAAAALLGRLAAAAVLRPVGSLAAAVQAVSATRDLSQRLPVSGHDEVGSLATNFNTMLAALDESQRAQQQLIADASHELRTPLTAHRANVELLARPDLPGERRPHVLRAAVRGIEELSTLISDVIQAARNGKSLDARAPVALHELVAAAVERARHRSTGLRFQTRLAPCTIVGASTRIERAVDNVLDNAIKWSPAGTTVEVTLSDGLLTVRDHGPGIDPADLPHVFDRFYRAAAARGLPGSGLGLAIVKQTVDDHGGSAGVTNADGGGTAIALRFDGEPAS